MKIKTAPALKQAICLATFVTAILPLAASAGSLNSNPPLLQFCAAERCSEIQFNVPISECRFSTQIVLRPGQTISLSARGTAEGSYNRYTYGSSWQEILSYGSTVTNPMGVTVDRGDLWHSRHGTVGTNIGELQARLKPLSVAQAPGFASFKFGGSVVLSAPQTAGTPGYQLEFFVPSCGPTTFPSGSVYLVDAVILSPPPAPATPVETPTPPHSTEPVAPPPAP